MTQGERTAANPKQPILGVAEPFAPGDRECVEPGMQALESLGVHHVRVRLSRADWCSTDGRAWYEWLIGALARRLVVLPCLAYTLPSSATSENASLPQEDPKAFADFVDSFMNYWGGAFEWVELPSEPDDTIGWDWRLDPRGRIFSEIIGSAAYRCRQRGMQTVLGSLRPRDPGWLSLLCENGVVDFADAIGLHVVSEARGGGAGPPAEAVDKARRILEEHRRSARIWITEAGCSTPNHHEFAQVQMFAGLLDTDVERVYWCSLRDLDPASPRPNGSERDERRCHWGLCRRDGTPKLLFRLWDSQGIEGVRRIGRYGSNRGKRSVVDDNGRPGLPSGAGCGVRTPRPSLITGGAGFIGSNLAERLLRSGRPVIILDNLSRNGVEQNVKYLCETYGDLIEVHVSDVRDNHIVEELVTRCGGIFHLAAQAAVTAGLADPVGDFESNLQGTVNILEAARKQDSPPPLLFTSTHKVYGDLRDIELVPSKGRYVPRDHKTRTWGIDESRPLEFHGPYGCSKGAADQYVLDYARIYGLPNVVFRMSCIYGRRQFGTVDQGWVTHIALQMLHDGQLNLYGDARQVGDILHVDDLIDAMLLALENIELVAGKAFNIGGGPDNAVSLREAIERLSDLSEVRPQVHYGPRRKGDQPYYVSDTRNFTAATGWTPRISVEQGMSQLYRWIREDARASCGPAKYGGAAGGIPERADVL